MFQNDFGDEMHTLLLIEDDRTLCQMLRGHLEQDNYIVFEANTGQRSLDIVKQHKVDLVLLDLHLPDGNGLDFIGGIKNCTKSPMVVMSADSNPAMHIAAFEAGADDFVMKPFHLKEMGARIHSHIRRREILASNENAAASKLPDESISFGGWRLDPQRHQIFDRNNCENSLTACEFKILKILLENDGIVLKREDLCEAVREENYKPSPRAIDIKITRIRRKLGDNAADPKLIKTVRGVGYIINTGLNSGA